MGKLIFLVAFCLWLVLPWQIDFLNPFEGGMHIFWFTIYSIVFWVLVCIFLILLFVDQTYKPEDGEDYSMYT